MIAGSSLQVTGSRGRRIPAIGAVAGLLMAFAISGLVAADHDYVAEPPATVYEDAEMSPQNMDYDAANKMFIAHPGWLNDRLIHYYKFRMYTPMTYPSKVPMGGPPVIPVGELYLLTTDGSFAGILANQKPILRWHTADGENYSDFVAVHWVRVDSAYEPNTYRSFGDIDESVSAEDIVASDVYVNLPVVPTGSKLQDPIALGTTAAPIRPLMAWYRGVEVQTFVFETTSRAFADHFNPLTRDGAAAQEGSGYEIAVADFVSNANVLFIPIWHLNQYPMGVVEGVNHGGPWRGGQRNLINLDRRDAGYSPLWQVLWASGVPVGYTADLASNAAQLTPENGFVITPTPMFVNCPNVGPHGGGPVNPDKLASFGEASVGPGETFTIAGALVMEADAPVYAYLGATEIGETATMMMGAYMFELSSDLLPDGRSSIVVRNEAGDVLQSVSVTKAAFGPLGVPLPTLIAILAVVGVAALVSAAVIRSRRRRSPRAPPPLR